MIAAAVLIASCFASPPGLDGQGAVLPPPLLNRGLGSQFVLDPSTFKLVAGPGAVTDRLQRALARYHDLVFDYGPAAHSSAAKCGGPTGFTQNATCLPLSQLTINVADSADDNLTRFTNESYSLNVDVDRSELNATSIYGALRGLQTFSQLVMFNVSSATYTMFGVQVVDTPRFEYRGVMVDTSRNFVSLDELKVMCDLMESNKMNALHLHLTDDQSWPIEIEGFPRLTEWLSYGNFPFDTPENGSTSHIFKVDAVKEMVSYCQDRAVRIIPEVDMPGHCSRAPMAYPEYFVEQDNPHGCAANKSLICPRGMIDITTDHGFELVDGIWKSLVDTFPGGEYHIGGDEVDIGPWANSTAIHQWLAAHSTACPDDANITCGTMGDLQPYFTRRVVSIIQKHRPDAQIQGWNPGIGGFYRHGNLGARFPTFTYNDWNGNDNVWQGGIADMTDPAKENASVILSGPFYVFTDTHSPLAPEAAADWEEMMHLDILNFTGGDKRKVRGACLTAWGDAAKVDSGNTVFSLARYMAGMAINLWSPNGTIADTGDPVPWNASNIPNSCNGDDYGICDVVDWHRCRNMMRGLPGGRRARGFGVPCAVPYSPPVPRTWYRSDKLPPLPPSSEVAAQRTDKDIIEQLREQLRRAGIAPEV